MNRGYVWVSGRPKYGWSEPRSTSYTVYETHTQRVALLWTSGAGVYECYEVKYSEADVVLKGGAMHFVSRYWLLRKKAVAGYRPIGAVL